MWWIHSQVRFLSSNPVSRLFLNCLQSISSWFQWAPQWHVDLHTDSTLHALSSCCLSNIDLTREGATPQPMQTWTPPPEKTNMMKLYNRDQHLTVLWIRGAFPLLLSVQVELEHTVCWVKGSTHRGVESWARNLCPRFLLSELWQALPTFSLTIRWWHQI